MPLLKSLLPYGFGGAGKTSCLRALLNARKVDKVLEGVEISGRKLDISIYENLSFDPHAESASQVKNSVGTSIYANFSPQPEPRLKPRDIGNTGK